MVSSARCFQVLNAAAAPGESDIFRESCCASASWINSYSQFPDAACRLLWFRTATMTPSTIKLKLSVREEQFVASAYRPVF